MAIFTWLGGTSSNPATGANWVGGAAPGATDSVLWNSPTTYPIAGTFNAAGLTGTVTITEQATASAANGGATFGTSSTPVDFNGNVTGAIRIAIRGNVFLSCTGDTNTSLSLEMPAGYTATLSAGTHTTVVAINCNVDVGASAVVTNAYSIGSRWTFATNGTAVTLLEGYGHVTMNSRSLTTGNLQPLATLVMAGNSAGTTLNVSRQAVVVHQSSADMATVNLMPGSTITPAGNPNATATIGGTMAFIWSGATVVENVAGCQLTVTNKTFRGPASAPAGSPS